MSFEEQTIVEISSPVGFYKVGKQGVSKITFKERNYGDHGIGYFNVYINDKVHCSITHKESGKVTYD